MKRMNHLVDKKSVNLFSSKLVEKRMEEIMKHPYVVKFLLENQSEIRPSQWNPYWVKLNQYIRETDHCKQCPGLDQCPNMVRGHYPSLKAYMGQIDLVLNECDKLQNEKMKQRRNHLIQCYDIPKEVREATFESLEMDRERIEAITAAVEFCEQYLVGKKEKGLYFFGTFGVGKSHIAGAIANALANHDVPVLMVHTPALAIEMKDAISEAMRGNRLSPSVRKKLDLLASIPVLILDDIGTETYTAWLRDQVFGVVLHSRAAKRLPTIYTSNLTLDELEVAFSWIQNKGQTYEDRVGAKRIMERIRPYVIPVEVGGRNRRYCE